MKAVNDGEGIVKTLSGENDMPQNRLENRSNRPLPPVATRFKPGQSGNPGGRPKGIVRKALVHQFRTEVAAGVKRGDVMADAVMAKAESGDLATATFLRDTIDGLPTRNDGGNSTNVGVAVTVHHVGEEKD